MYILYPGHACTESDMEGAAVPPAVAGNRMTHRLWPQLTECIVASYVPPAVRTLWCGQVSATWWLACSLIVAMICLPVLLTIYQEAYQWCVQVYVDQTAQLELPPSTTQVRTYGLH